MQILFVAPELHPYVKTGGLGDVAQALPVALSKAGLDVRVLVPGYRALLKRTQRTALAEINCPFLATTATITLVNGSHPPLMVLEHAAFYDRDGGPYQNAAGSDWPDNAERYALFCHAGAQLCGSASVLPWRADIVHCNDWQSGLVPAYLKLRGETASKSVMTIHNLAFQGIFPSATLPRVGLPPATFSMQGVEFYGNLSFLKAGLVYADRITTVSRSYAAEIQQPELGFGLDGVLLERSSDLVGILNGIDTSEWNPANDATLPNHYDIDSLDAKRGNKRALQIELGLKVDAARPLLGMVSRIGEQKGSDLLVELLPQLLDRGVQLAVLGSGDKTLEQALLDAAARAPQQLAVGVGYNEGLAHRIEAGSDMFLMPSRFEPCGLNQMYSMRYGTPPIVHATGGLRDTVCDPMAAQLDEATGFAFDSPDAASLLAAVDRALALWRDPTTWRRIQRNGMQRDFSWQKSAEQYAELYRALLQPDH